VKLTKEQVAHVANLARLGLTDEELERYVHELSGIVGYVEQLESVDTQGVAATAQVTGLSTILREDAELKKPLAEPAELLNCSQRFDEQSGQIIVPNVF